MGAVMRKLLVLLISVVVVFGGRTAQAGAWIRQDLVPPTAMGAITGHVTEADGVTPIASLSLVLLHSNFSWAGSTTTDETGAYHFSGLSPGRYVAYTNKIWYVYEYYDNAPNLSTARQIPVTEGSTMLNIDFVLDKYPQITGTVTEADGVTPIGGASVYVFAPDGSFAFGGSYTDADGTYAFYNLPGTYIVRAQVMNRVPEYYANQTTPEAATPITVALNTITPDIHFSLGVGGGISGSVTAADGSPPITVPCGGAGQ